jgi:acyl-[acyl-carrier-protein]-phospholipid O-acyltransferase/long-chain-fatty-acid--[acyl-carrier-protein] ligase
LPKGVALSHQNLLANVEQSRAIVAYTPRDVVFNALPMFHAFGLTGGTLVPLLHGVKIFMHPTPLHYRVIPELIYQSNATILFGTDTFLTGYAKTADSYDLYRVRMIFAGAEKVGAETRNTYAQKFGVPIYEGYGVTECAPVVAVNTPMYHQAGTVGRLLPGMEYRLESVLGIENGAQLWLRGPNIMKGYYKADAPGVLQPLTDGWYDTGDIVSMDDAGYITILGRAKRFAKIGGEMISLAAIENYAAQCWPEAQHAAIAVPDARKGEAIILVTNRVNANLETLSGFMKSAGATELSIPKTIHILSMLPVLGSGKTDYVTLKSMLTSVAT